VTAGAVVLAGVWSLSSYLCVQQALLAQEPFVRPRCPTAATVRHGVEERPDLLRAAESSTRRRAMRFPRREVRSRFRARTAR
jgi:hypothetical protein